MLPQPRCRAGENGVGDPSQHLYRNRSIYGGKAHGAASRYGGMHCEQVGAPLVPFVQRRPDDLRAEGVCKSTSSAAESSTPYMPIKRIMHPCAFCCNAPK